MLTKIQYAFIRHIASNSSNTVIGLVRNKAATDERLAKDGIKNVTIIEADITDYAALQKAAAETSKLTGGSLDYLINNAALLFGKQDTMDLVDL
jgi:NAD(P)-dependent dehydrogenase (short-subunit alcohol dehydrogenase family)